MANIIQVVVLKVRLVRYVIDNLVARIWDFPVSRLACHYVPKLTASIK